MERSLAARGETGEGDRLIQAIPFEQEHEDFTATQGITALIQSEGAYLIADFPLAGEFAGEWFIAALSWSPESIARCWRKLTGHTLSIVSLEGRS